MSKTASGRRAAWTALLVAAILGCAHVPAPSPESRPSRILLDVPFYPQRKDYCGPASLASVLNHWGARVTQEEVGRRVYLPKLQGTLTLDMLTYPRRLGFRTQILRGDLELLREHLRKGHPLITLHNLGFSWFPWWHYRVVVGMDEEEGIVFAHSGRYPQQPIPYGSFLATWKRAGFWTLLVLPPGDAQGWMRLGEHHERKGRYALARKAYRAALRLAPGSPDALWRLGNAAYLAGDLEEAEGWYRKALAAAPDRAEVRNNLAWLYLRLGRHLDRAEHLAREAARLDPDPRRQPAYLDTLGAVLLRRGKVAEAIRVLREGIDKLGKGAPARVERSLRRRLAEAYQALGVSPETERGPGSANRPGAP